jgi:hypothetical protein
MISQWNTAACGLGLWLVAVSAFGQTTGPAGKSTFSVYLPPIGLAATETAQVNVVNAAQLSALPGAGPLCSGTIVFYGGADGYSILGQIAPFQVTFGQMFSAGLSYSATGASGSRTVIRAEITLSPYKVLTDTGIQITHCSLAASLETFDTVTGVTHAVVSASGTADFSGEIAQVRSGGR